jgi:hypothetical protein
MKHKNKVRLRPTRKAAHAMQVVVQLDLVLKEHGFTGC